MKKSKKEIEKDKLIKELKIEQKKFHRFLTHPIFKTPNTFGQKASDSLTQWAGSWTFIISFLVFIAIWMIINLYGWVNEWDPYPFILLNLVLSCIAAIQAPIILMSQNRQAQRDRQKAEFDYKINRKAEAEIRDIKRLLVKHFKK